MKTRELKQTEWKNFCRDLHETRRDGLVTIQRVEPAGATVVMADVPLQGIAFKENQNSCNDELLIETGLPGERPRQHVIVEPVRLILRNGSGERYNQLEIVAESGTTLVIFHPGINPTSLTDLAPRATV